MRKSVYDCFDTAAQQRVNNFICLFVCCTNDPPLARCAVSKNRSETLLKVPRFQIRGKLMRIGLELEAIYLANVLLIHYSTLLYIRKGVTQRIFTIVAFLMGLGPPHMTAAGSTSASAFAHHTKFITSVQRINTVRSTV